MSVHSTTMPAAEAAGSSRRRALGWLTGGATLTAAVVAAAIALWPASEADKARADGEAFGAAVAQLQSATTQAEAETALADVRAAVADTREHAGDAVYNQAVAQEDALERAVDGFVGANTSTEAWEADLYELELEVAVDDLTANAEQFRTTGPEVQEAFWQGYETGHAG